MTARIAQIGCGYWGKNLTRNFAELGALVAVVDNDPEVAERMAKNHNVEAATLDEVLSRDDIDAISFATPAETHADLALKAFEAGKHVFVEKPMALTTKDAKEIMSAAEQSGKIFMVGHLLQYHPIFVRLREEIEKGRIGKIQYIYSNRLSLGKFRTEENVLWSFAPHDISMILSLAQDDVVHVSAQGASFVTPDIADVTTAQLTFQSGMKAHVFASWAHPFKEHRLVVVGDNGMIVFEDSNTEWDEKLAYYAHQISKGDSAPVAKKADAEFIKVENSEPLKTECAHFIDCIQTGQQPRTDIKEAYAVLDVLEQAENCLRSGL